MKNSLTLVMNATLTAIIGKNCIAVHVVAGTMATQSRLVKIVTLWTFERIALVMYLVRRLSNE